MYILVSTGALQNKEVHMRLCRIARIKPPSLKAEFFPPTFQRQIYFNFSHLFFLAWPSAWDIKTNILFKHMRMLLGARRTFRSP